MEHKWLWRERGVPVSEIWAKLKAAAAKNISYEQNPVLGFPGTTPLRDALDVHRWFAGGQPNNIGYHTTGTPAEFGFPGTQELEREFIYYLAGLVGAADPEKDVDGYICMGGTEGNDHGLWLGRNRLRGKGHAGKRGIVVLASFLSHYSIYKHFGRLFSNELSDGRDVDVLQELPVNSRGEVDAGIVDRAVREFHSNGYRGFLLVLTAGTTNMGSVDRVEEICDAVAVLKRTLGIRAHIHVDAAYGGFVLPFLEPDLKFGFHNQLVDSVVVDAHKMGYAPYSAGVFLCRKGLLAHTTTPAVYLGGHFDSTVCGSRSGAIAAACWTLTQVMGREEYEAKLRECMANLEYLRERLRELNRNGEERVRFYPARMNIQAAWVDEEIKLALDAPGSDGRSLRAKFCIPEDMLPADLTNLAWDGRVVVRDAPVVRFMAMPHLSKSKIDEFMDELMARVAQFVH